VEVWGGSGGCWVELFNGLGGVVGSIVEGGIVVVEDEGIFIGSSSRNEYEGASLGVTDPYRKMVSSNVTCRESIILLVARSRQRYPRWFDEYPRKMHGVDRGPSLWDVST
jgi:hypothetical protein